MVSTRSHSPSAAGVYDRSMADEAGGPLSAAELDEFLAQPHLLKLACVRPDGWPYVIPLWFAWDDGKLHVVGRERAVWIDYIQREPRVGVLIDEDARRHRRAHNTPPPPPPPNPPHPPTPTR